MAKSTSEEKVHSQKEWAMVIHGGAGTILESEMTPEKFKQFHGALDSALTIGQKILASNGSALDAIEATIKFLEDSPYFNAGRGAVFTHEGKNELDASVMDGSNKEAGAVGGVTNIKHPISAAIKVMTNSPHVMMVGRGAEQFSKQQGLEQADPSWFKTDRRWESLQKILQKEKSTGAVYEEVDSKFGTVGAVALDKNGNLAAGTSTGGMTNKKFNRIGDSPIIGAGTYADNQLCGVSCTGHGEFFIRYAVAHDVAARMDYLNETVEEASDFIINTKLKEVDGSGGLIALDKNGNYAMPFNTAGMYRGYISPDERFVKMYKE